MNEPAIPLQAIKLYELCADLSRTYGAERLLRYDQDQVFMGVCELAAAAEAKVADLQELLEGALNSVDTQRSRVAEQAETILQIGSNAEMWRQSMYELERKVLQQAATIERLTSGGTGLIAQERLRQVEQEGWSAEHDDEHLYGELAKRAAALAIDHTDATVIDDGEQVHPWKKHRAPRSLVIAGALIAAEIDRLLRADAALNPQVKPE